jgi:Reverse transcriptase (RNA-dependent DNA polymerase)
MLDKNMIFHTTVNPGPGTGIPVLRSSSTVIPVLKKSAGIAIPTYDNVLVDFFCEKMFNAHLPIQLVRVMWNLLWEKRMLFYCDGQVVEKSVGFKGLPQGSTLSPFSYRFYTSEVDLFLPSTQMTRQFIARTFILNVLKGGSKIRAIVWICFMGTLA